ncbi:flagellar hook-basal body protein [Ruminococcaceae bacterium OttesenSCG-928-O06]|nr:flagellar hook-basal body protein [Ruminococcaceae bacterium OttesenSCG-928-O06]
MLQGFYSAASGMLMQQRHLNVVANNLANAQTPGYKTNRLVSTTFQQALLARLEPGNSAYIGTGESTRIVDEVADIWTEGGIMETGRPFDLAITGYGFFNVQGADGTVYLTRNGQFDLDDEGFLMLPGEGRVLGANGAPIQVTTSDINVSATGAITNSVTGAAIGQLAITEPTEDAVVEQARNTMYTATATQPAGQPGIVQGAYENSNVNLTDELTAMIIAQRNFSSASQALQFIDATYAKAVNIAAL